MLVEKLEVLDFRYYFHLCWEWPKKEELIISDCKRFILYLYNIYYLTRRDNTAENVCQNVLHYDAVFVYTYALK